MASAIIKIYIRRDVQKAERTVKLEKLCLRRYSDMSLQPEYPLRTVLRRGSNNVTLSKGMDFCESQFRSRSINMAAEATEDNQDAHSQEPSEIQTTHQASSSCFKGEILCWHEAHPIQKSVYCILLQHATKISKTAEQHTESNCI